MNPSGLASLALQAGATHPSCYRPVAGLRGVGAPCRSALAPWLSRSPRLPSGSLGFITLRESGTRAPVGRSGTRLTTLHSSIPNQTNPFRARFARPPGGCFAPFPLPLAGGASRQGCATPLCPRPPALAVPPRSSLVPALSFRWRQVRRGKAWRLAQIASRCSQDARRLRSYASSGVSPFPCMICLAPLPCLAAGSCSRYARGEW